MKKIGVSVIIPCYNVEKYICKCLDSIVNQLKRYNYEIILVNDCSTDKTKSVIDNYIKNKDNIYLYNNKTNIGAGASRNLAIKKAKYDLISFIDADDYIDDLFFDTLIDGMEKSKSDVAVCDIILVDENDSTQTRCKACNFVTSKYNVINTGLAASPCNKIFKKDLLKKYPFAEGIMNEDIPCVLSIICNCDGIYYSDKVAYYYIQHSESIQNSRLSNKRLELIKAVDLFEERIRGSAEYYDFMTSVLFNQLVCFLLYVPIKEKNVFRRGLFIRRFGKLSKKYPLRRNPLYWKFLSENKKSTRWFYKIYMKLACNGFGFFASAWLQAYDTYKLIRKKRSVIKNNITMKDLKRVAKKNQTYKSGKTLTVAVPNYNYEKFLYQRIYSILYQKYRINKLIILDDCSNDNSRLLIDEIVKELSPYICIEKNYNDVNSGSTFKQWKKILKLCDSDYLWIAEADDYCERTMISSLMKYINKNQNIRIAYVDTAFIDKDGSIILKTIKPEIDIMKTGHWNHDFVNDGKNEIKNYAFLNCTIANVSSVLFKVDDYSNIFEELVNYKQVGDYLFYLSVMEKGDICFVNKPLNYYRVHGNNVTSTTKKQLHFDELKRVHALLDRKYKFNKMQKKEISKRYKFLQKVWNVK